MKDPAQLLLMYLNKIMKMTLNAKELELKPIAGQDDLTITISQNVHIVVRNDKRCFMLVILEWSNQFNFSDELNASQVIALIESLIESNFIAVDNYARPEL